MGYKVKIVVAGSRGFDNYEFMKKVLDAFLLKDYKYEEIQIISGCANGADKLGERYADEHGCGKELMPADWDNLGKKAGYIRNAQMAEIGDWVICFWDRISSGTEHMINLGKRAGKIVKVIPY